MTSRAYSLTNERGCLRVPGDTSDDEPPGWRGLPLRGAERA